MIDPDDPPSQEPEAPQSPEDEQGLTVLLDHLKATRGFDFHGYKRASLARRVRRRMAMVGVEAFPDYLAFLQGHPDEIPQLFNMLLINVTGFFRDPAVWAALASHVERILASKPVDAPIRLWSAGSASGEEAYTLAILLAELLGLDAFVRRVKIYATDLDEDALIQGRQAAYPARSMEAMAPELVARYFTAAGSMFVVQKELRRAVLFGRHDLLQDAPISRIDVLACRNTLMYFNTQAQARVLNHLHFALAPDGVLFLGKAEMLITHLNLFTPVDLKLRLFTRASGSTRWRERLPGLDLARPAKEATDDATDRLSRTAFEALPMAALVLDPDSRVVLVNRRAMTLLGLRPQDVGRPFQDLEVSYRPVDLRSLLDEARTTRRVSSLKGIERLLPGGARTFLDVDVMPLLGSTGQMVGMQISFSDSTQVQHLHGELKKMLGELETSHEELQSTSEELETINEELQSTVEELETTNEELQSTNEELETMNEELQSTNEELQTLNDELRVRDAEVHRANDFLEGVLGSLRCGVAVIDGKLLVKAWNRRMEDLWGLRADEVEGRHLLDLDIGLMTEQVQTPIRTVLGDGEAAELSLDCINRRGRTARYRVLVQRLAVDGERGAILLVEDG